MPLGEPGLLYWFDPIAELLARLKGIQTGTTWCRTAYGGDDVERLHLAVLTEADSPADVRVLILDGPRAGETATLREIQNASLFRLTHTITYHYVPDDQLARAFR
jgi:hypothetical protein